uniref:Uncharacterized protein n=1 Tax=Salarias fasciatus TaxID=181472 RepID=A0A672FR15_SALFA
MANTEPWVGTWRPHRPRRPIAAMHQTPGPNKYLLPSLTGTSKHDPTKSKSPAFSMASRHLQSTVHHSPGPAHFVEPNTTRTGRHTALAVSLKGKRQSQVKLTPGPAAYGAVKLDKWKRKAPEYTIAGRPSAQQQNVTPGPAAHRPGPVRNLFACKFFVKRFSPGPAAYGAVKLDKWKRKAPEYTIAGRPSAQQQNVTTPGPAAHRPGKVPSFSFGVHHSQYKTPLILNDDY